MHDRLPVEFAPIRREHTSALAQLLVALDRMGDGQNFHPHPLDTLTADRIANHVGADYYCVGFTAAGLVSYGMLRGWDEGYDVPSAGLAFIRIIAAKASAD